VTFRGPIFSGHPPPQYRAPEFLPPNLLLHGLIRPTSGYVPVWDHPPRGPRAPEFLPPNVALNLTYPPRTTPFAYSDIWDHPPRIPHAPE
jgi:hypothetical protein